MTPILDPIFLSSGCIWQVSEDNFLIGTDLLEFSTIESANSDISNGVFYAPNFFLNNEDSFYKPKLISKFSRAKLIEALKELESYTTGNLVELRWQGIDSKRFSADFYSIQEMILKSDVEKIVLTGFDIANQAINVERLRQWIIKLLHTYKENHHIYGVWHGEAGILGATPEVLFEIDPNDNTLHTVALAGTRSIHHGESKLTEDKKETHEHDLVILGIRKALAPTNISLGTTTELILRNSSHLHTPITCKSDLPWNTFDLINKLHPTPALGAYPRSSGMQWLREHNHLGGGFPLCGRARFGAPLSWIQESVSESNNSPIKCLVAIRNVQWQNNQIFIGAGCGIVKQSILDRELNELESKITAVKEWVI